MEWELTKREIREFNKDFAMDGDMYYYYDGKLQFAGSGLSKPIKPSFFKRIKSFIWRKKNGIVVSLDSRTLEYIYNVCKGVMPARKRDFVDCVMSSLKH